MKSRAALFALLLVPSALAAPAARDVETAATRTAQLLDGVLRDCPASFAAVGTGQKKCVGVSVSVEQARVKLGAGLGGELYGVWRSRDGQRSVYNWLKGPGGYIYLRLQPDPEGRAQTLAYLDLPPSSTAQTDTSGSSVVGASKGASSGAGGSGQGSATGKATTPAARPAPRSTPSAQKPASAASPKAAQGPQPTLAPLPFSRVLGLQDSRLNGADVRAVQNRLISLLRPRREGQGDGWFGPVTAQTVRDFQAANDLPVTGRVDRATWNLLFSAGAKTFQARD